MTQEYFEPVVWNTKTLRERRKNLDALSLSGKWTPEYPNIWERFSICPVCKCQFFDGRHLDKIFCSKECKNQFYTNPAKTCPTCGAEHKNKIYCSKECQYKDPEYRRKLSKSMTKVMTELFPSTVRRRFR